MQAPCVAPAIRCAGCREVIYPSPPSSPDSSVSTPADNSPTARAVGSNRLDPQTQQQLLVVSPEQLAQAYQQNERNPLLQLLAIGSIASRVLDTETIGMTAL